MAIRTHDPELSDALDFLVKRFSSNDLHGECLLDKFPEKYKNVNCNGTNMIVWHNNTHDNCLNYCRETEILRMITTKTN